VGVPPACDSATVYIEILADNDCDGVADIDDIDDDNDGILDVKEGDRTLDSDLDGIPNSLDIDSDDDGIVDNIEGQAEGNYIAPTGLDSNNNGWDDAYDPADGGYEFDPVDTDDDSTPDYLDLDSENDNVFDFIEGHDINADGVPDVTRIFADSDNDGLDDIYDIVFGWNDPYDPFNALGSNSPLQDFDWDGTRDWRDVNDEDDDFLTVNEDINNDGDYSNDDLDLDGFPDYLDKTLDCELFIPEGFSPNGDDVHDFFQILCIQRYPNAKLMIFNRNGNKLFDKEHYGNVEFWGSNEDAWWYGISSHRWTIGQMGGLPSGNYVYVLELGNGKVEKGTVMISY
jgi:gliding motility-associated-like protein